MPFAARQLLEATFGPTKTRRVARAFGKPAIVRSLEIARLQFGPGRISRQEYDDYRLFDADRVTAEERRRFVGRAAAAGIRRRVADPRWVIAARDRLLFGAAMRGLGFRVPSVQAVFHRERAAGDATALRDADALAGWLRRGAAWPCHARPVDDPFSAVSGCVERYEPASDSLVYAAGAHVPLAEVVAEASRHAARGFLFEDEVRPHAAIAAVTGGRLARLRLTVMLDGDGPQTLAAILTVPAGGNVADSHWLPGNILCVLDPATGEVVRTARGRGPDLDHPARHPDTGHPLMGFRLQEWDHALELCLSAANAFQGIALQAWDVAMTPDGPMLLALDVGGDPTLSQSATGRGFMDRRFEDFLARCAGSSARHCSSFGLR